MKQLNSFKKKVFDLHVEDFSSHAMDLFSYQYANNSIYKKYVDALGIDIHAIMSINEIPFMPIEFFKQHDIKTTEWTEEYIFWSSGTTDSVRSRHFIEDMSFYRQNAGRLFEREYGNISKDLIIGLLPSYSEQGHSSLICMVDYLMTQASDSGYYLNDFRKLEELISGGLKKFRRVIMFGVGYALIDFADAVGGSLDGLQIIETGGMKGRREEMTKDEFYKYLKKRMGNVIIRSEYGMTELMSQAYSNENKIFKCPDTMRVLVRDLHDPFSIGEYNKTGGINVIDLANIHSCAFIETRDIGRVYKNGTFEVLGRIDNSDIRGCNLLVQ